MLTSAKLTERAADEEDHGPRAVNELFLDTPAALVDDATVALIQPHRCSLTVSAHSLWSWFTPRAVKAQSLARYDRLARGPNQLRIPRTKRS